MANGIFTLLVANPKYLDSVDWESPSYYITVGCMVATHQIALFVVIWSVMFKYWQTSQQLGHILRATTAESHADRPKEQLERKLQENMSKSHPLMYSSDAILQMRLKRQHVKHRRLKVSGYIAVTVVSVTHGLVSALNERWQIENSNGINLGYTLVICVCDISNVVFYLLTLCMLASSVRLLREFANKHSMMGADRKTALLHMLMILILVVTTAINDFVLLGIWFSLLGKADVRVETQSDLFFAGRLVKSSG